MRILLQGSSLTLQLIFPFVNQVRKYDSSIKFQATGMIVNGHVHTGDESELANIEKSHRPYLGMRLPKRINHPLIDKIVRRAHREVAVRTLRFRSKSFLREIDLLHIQGLFSPKEELRYCKIFHRKPIVVSCWGSDVLRTDSPKTYTQQQRVLKRADAITVCSPEFRDIVLAKYGQDLREKIYFTQFSPNIEGVLEADHDLARENFRESHKIEPEKVCVGIGHNGHEANQHLGILESIKKLNPEISQLIHLILPMTYGSQPAYLEKVKAALVASGLTYEIITEFMDDQAVAELRHALDVFIYAPISDAFSASVSQALAAGSECILGSWLPYKLRAQAGLKYTEINTIEEAGEALASVIPKNLGDKDRQLTNRTASIEMFNPEKLGRQWASVYQAAKNSAQLRNHPS